jgi:hypothetical protein
MTIEHRFRLAAIAALGVLALGASSAQADVAKIVVTYTTPTSLKVALGDGTPVPTGTTIPAGVYQIEVNDDPNTGDQKPQFTVSGPGVSVNSDLDSTGMGIDGLSSFGPFNFQTSSSYSIEDKTLGASTIVTFTTSATATATGNQTTTATATAGGSNSNGMSTSTKTAMKGTLAAAVSAAGKATLSFDGKAVKTLAPGRYTVTVQDRSRHAGLLLGEGAKHPLTLSGAAAEGKSSHTVTLSAGTWYVRAATGSPKTSFRVT